jgi:hypothetical protein
MPDTRDPPARRATRWALGVLGAAALALVAVMVDPHHGGNRDDVRTDDVRTGDVPATEPGNGTIARRSGPLAGAPLAALPEAGFADVTEDGVVLLSFDGTELARAGGWPGAAPAPGTDLVIRDAGGRAFVESAPPDPAQAPDGCSDAAGAGGTRVAIREGRTQIDRVEPDGTRTRLAAVVQGTTWTQAVPSPDGRWVLAQIAAGCGKPLAVVHPTEADGANLTPDDEDSERVAVGWLPDGRAVMQVVGDGCRGTGVEPYVFAFDPGDDEAVVLSLAPQGVLHGWRRAEAGPDDDDRTFHRARRQLELGEA